MLSDDTLKGLTDAAVDAHESDPGSAFTIHERTLTDMEQTADKRDLTAARFNQLGYTSSAHLCEQTAADYRRLIEVAYLLRTDGRLRDALSEARDRAAASRPDGAPVETPPAVAGPMVFETVPRECNACREPATRFADGLLWCEPCHDMTGPGAVNMVPVEVPSATLVVSRSYSACARCGSQVLPSKATHDVISGYGGGEPGCGARFTAITSDGNRLDAFTRATLADMRPDLPIVEYGDRMNPPAGDPDDSPTDGQDAEAAEVDLS